MADTSSFLPSAVWLSPRRRRSDSTRCAQSGLSEWTCVCISARLRNTIAITEALICRARGVGETPWNVTKNGRQAGILPGVLYRGLIGRVARQRGIEAPQKKRSFYV